MGRIKGDFDDFEVWVYAPPREHHSRPHVHLISGDYEISIALPTTKKAVELLEYSTGTPKKLIRTAVTIVEDNAEQFRKEWDNLHGKTN